MHLAPHRSILLLTRGLEPVGVGRQVELAASGLRARGWDVKLAVTTGGGSVPERLARAGFPVHRLGRRPGVGPDVAVGLARLAKADSSAAILSFGRSQAVVAGAVRRVLPVLRVVCQLSLPPRGVLAAWALRQADRVVAASPAVARACLERGVPTERVCVVPPGVSPAAGTGLSREQLAERLGLRAQSIWTLCVAPWEPASHLDRLIWAIDQLGVVHQGLEHVLVGAGPLLGKVRRRARVQQLAERLHVFPMLDCLPDLLPRVRLVWQSGNVACGGALLDGMAHGIGTVAVESDAARQLILPGVTGTIVPADPESEFPRRALNLIEDDALAARYGSAARARVAEFFSAESYVAGVEAALLEAVQ